ncbi:hypothetical protein BD413DRAFT_609481 [Trametes elegans]|nr:hypothetical protein BD413DRAFT_609481 [Trametes elegans]
MRLPAGLAPVLLVLCAGGVFANTEIVNFEVAAGPDGPLPYALETVEVGPESPQRLLEVQPASSGTALVDVCEPPSPDTVGGCPHEAWLALNLDAPPWSASPKFTVRVSWPASHPAAFRIDTYTPAQLASRLHPAPPPPPPPRHATARTTRRTYARVRVVHDGVFAPSPAARARAPEPVPFVVTVEPLRGGIVPASLVPTLVCLAAVVAAAGAFVLPRVQRALFALAEAVRAEVAAEEERRKR